MFGNEYLVVLFGFFKSLLINALTAEVKSGKGEIC